MTTATTTDRHATTAQASEASIVIKGNVVTRSAVLDMIAECEEIGRAAFLENHGFAEATRYHLRHNGRSYPTKAIIGAAAGLTASDLFGGIKGAAGQLARLGFVVRNSETGELLDTALDGLRIECGGDVAEPAWPEMPVVPSAYFASGSNRPAEIRGLGKAGADVGAAAPHVTPAAEAELVTLAGSEVAVFVDSGAFSEVEFSAEAGGFVINPAKHLTHAKWKIVLALYRRLAVALGSQLSIVAPDRVGSQDETLLRLRRYAPQVRELIALGANVFVAIQKGERTQAEFATLVDTAIGSDAWVPAMPCKKAATTPAEVRAFLAARKPGHVHLLGLGIRNRKLAEYLAPFAVAGCGATVSLDSCWITANAGRKGRQPRRFTRAQDRMREVLGDDFTTARMVEGAIYCCHAGNARA